MPLLKNLHYGAIAITLDNGRTITLPAREIVEVSEDDFAQLAAHPHFTEGRIAALPSGVAAPSRRPDRGSRPTPSS